MSRHFPALVALVVVSSAGCMCGIEPVQDCNGMPCPDGGSAGGTTAGGGNAGGGTAMGGGSVTSGGSAGGDAGGSTAGGDAGGSTAGGAVAGGAVAGGSTAGGAVAGGAVAGGAVAGGAVAGGAVAGGAVAGGATAGGTTGDGGMAYDFCGEIAQRQCDFFIRCTTSGVNGFTANDQLASSQRVACEARQRADCDEAQGAFARGRTAVDLPALRTCLDAIYPSASCARDQNANTSLCLASAYTTPLAMPGTLCANDSECLAGFCNVGGGQTCGTCSVYRNPDGGVGQCSRDAQCAPGTYCRNGTCAPRAGADAGCTSTGSCAAGLICPDPGVAQRFCTVGKLEGAACTKGRLECARTSGNFELVCATQFTADGGVDVCTKRFNTSPGGVCNTGEQPTGAGVPAAPTCLDSEYCDNGLCANKRMIGQPCGTNTEACFPGARCVNGTCAAFADVGGMCPTNGSTAGCKEFLYCTGNTCQPQFVDAGVACTTNGNPQCIANTTYCPGGGGAVCVATKTNGTSCNASRECAGGLCTMGQCTNLCYR